MIVANDYGTAAFKENLSFFSTAWIMTGGSCACSMRSISCIYVDCHFGLPLYRFCN